MSNESDIERLTTDIKIDEARKTNLNEELARLRRKLDKIKQNLKDNISDLDTIEEFERNINNAADDVQDAAVDINGYFQGNLADKITKNYNEAEEELTDIHNQMANEYNRINIEVENLKREKNKTEEEIEDIKRRIARLDENIQDNSRLLHNLQNN